MRNCRRLAVITALCVLLSGCASKDMMLSNQGFDAIGRNDYVSAEKFLEESLALNPNNPYALLNMGVVYEKTGRSQKALAMYQKVVDLNTKEEVVKSNNTAAEGATLTDLARSNLKRLKKKIVKASPIIEEPVREELPVSSHEVFSTPETPKLKEPVQRAVKKKKTVQAPQPSPPATTKTIQIVGEKALSPAKTKKSVPKGKFYSVQVASYKNSKYAAARVKELKEWGFDAFQQEARIKNTLYHRIFIGSFKTKNEALEKAKALKELHIIADYLIRYIKS